jgi:hypothetical protein
MVTEGQFPVLEPSPPFRPNAPRQLSFRRAQHLSPAEEADARVPFGGEPSPDGRAGNSRASSIYPASEEGARPGAPFAEAERPLSTGQVVHYLASDSIRQGAYDHPETMAELVEDSYNNANSGQK